MIAIVQGVLALLSILQHDAIFSDLLRKRVSVIAQTSDFACFVNMEVAKMLDRLLAFEFLQIAEAVR